MALPNKIEELGCSIPYPQQTKREMIDATYHKKFCTRRLIFFEFLPFVGASGGLLTAWNEQFFHGQKVFENKFSLTI